MLRKLSKHCKRPNLLESFNRTWEGNRHMAIFYQFYIYLIIIAFLCCITWENSIKSSKVTSSKCYFMIH